MSRLFGPIFQLAYVVEEIEPALEHWTRTLGVGPFFMFPTPLPFNWLRRDEQLTEDYDILSHAALAYSGDVMIELIRPGSAPSPYREFLDAGRRGVHHVGTVATDYDAQMAAARAAGIRVAIEGELPISRFSYLATDILHPGTMLELIDMSQEMKDLFATIKSAGANWDGKDPVRTLT
ncbi:VOC family protein [Sphingosinicella soli]|uniref:VOC domain-containing protein n=1 Tax=Sphingosinicella soli TaxID=333708 RepID=A0A7W7B1Y3_9SPHN|nr:VOC family protein [Sphingosinicella soli]MBB4632384.1 hypothetical protein [Sphingosinicella soli]